jgi:hypothetical protein
LPTGKRHCHGIAHGKHLSTDLPPFIEEMYIKQWMENKEIIYYKRYIEDILTIFDQNKQDEKKILNHMNNIDKHLEFKLSEE